MHLVGRRGLRGITGVASVGRAVNGGIRRRGSSLTRKAGDSDGGTADGGSLSLLERREKGILSIEGDEGLAVGADDDVTIGSKGTEVVLDITPVGTRSQTINNDDELRLLGAIHIKMEESFK